MSELEFNTQTDEVMSMVNVAHHNHPRPWGIIVSGEQVQHLLELEANRNKLAKEIEKSKRALAWAENHNRELAKVQERMNILPRIIGTGVRLSFPMVYWMGAKDGLMDPWFALILGVPCIAWAMYHWRTE